jgi:hypothetical protein
VKPTVIQDIISGARDSGDKMRLLITETPLNLDVYIQDFEHTWGGGFGDCDYSITLVKARQIKVYTEAEWKGQTPGVISTAPKLQERPVPPPPQTYPVKSGDSLWIIAKKMLQDGSKWPVIYNDPYNRKLIGANPNIIQVGMVLRIPSGSTQEGGVVYA